MLALLACLGVCGCPGGGADVPEIGGEVEPGQPATKVADDTKVPTESDRLRRSQCEQKLATAIAGTSYDRLDIDTDRSTQLADLNAWVATCFDAETAADLTNDDELRDQFLPASLNEVVSQKNFAPVDLLHLRNAQFSNAIGQAAVEDASDDVAVMVDLFAKVIRNVQLVDASIGEIPYDPFTFWQAGIGSARDRAWLFALLLQQYRIDPIVIEFPAGFNAQPYLLVAGVTRGESARAYLFDPITGLPIPALDDAGAIPSRPATWSDAQKNDAIFRALDTDTLTYPLRSDRFANARVFLVGGVSMFSPRMAAVQDELPATESFQVYEGLGDNAFAGDGLIARIATALNIESERVLLWPYGLLGRLPQIQPTEQVQRIMMNRETVLSAPYDATIVANEDGSPKLDADGNQRVVISLRNETLSKMREARVAHLTGAYSKASRAYLMVRVAEPPLPQNTQAAIDAAYWTTVFQYESGKVDNAKSSLQSFLKRADRGAWEISARRLLATILAEEDDFEGAIDVANGPAVDLGLLALIDRWRDQGRLAKPNQSEEDPKSGPNAESSVSEKNSGSVSDAKTMEPDESIKDGPKETADSKKEAASTKSSDTQRSTPGDVESEPGAQGGDSSTESAQ